MRKRRAWLLWAAAVVAIALVAAACGGEEEEAEEAPPPAAEEAPEIQTEVELSGIGTVVADQEANDPEVLKKAIQSENWAWPVRFVDCDSPDVDPNGCIPKSPEAEVPGVYTPLPAAEVTKQWNICVSFPHLKDAYWVASNYGAVAESRRFDLKMQLVEAGGYVNLPRQISQIEDCVAGGADAVVIGAISAEGNCSQIAELLEQGIVVIDLINGVNCETSGHSLINFYKMGFAAGEYLASLEKALKVGWYPGPPGAGWVESSNQGFRDATADSQVEILETKYGDTGKDVQLRLVENGLRTFPAMDYVGGTAVTAEAAVAALAERGLQEKVKVVGDYMIPTTYDFIQKGDIECAPTDQNPMQVRIAIDMAVRLLEKKPFIGGAERVEPNAQLVCGPGAGPRENLERFVFESTFAPPGFKPTFGVG